MARLRTVTIGVVNIKIYPHTPELYVELFDDLFRIRNKVGFRGNNAAIPNHISPLDPENSLSGIKGSIYKFTRINPNDPWIDTVKVEPLEDKNGLPIFPIAQNLSPNLKTIQFVFYPEGHRLLFDTQYITPGSMQLLLNALFSTEEIVQKYNDVEVIVEKAEDILQQILAIPIITKLTVSLTRPNAESFAEEEKKRVLDRMNQQNARIYDQTFSANKYEGFTPDATTRAAMDLAQSNGEIFAEGYNSNDEKVVESTKPHPLIIKKKYDPDVDSFFSIVIGISANLIDRLTSKG